MRPAIIRGRIGRPKFSEVELPEYQPEVGQALFGQPTQQFAVPEIMVSVLERIARVYEMVYWNANQEEIENPFYNSGPRCNLKTDVFEVCAYSWTEDDQPYNFAWRDLRISWYKWCGRGASSNIEITPEMASQCLEECLKSLWEMDEDREKMD